MDTLLLSLLLCFTTASGEPTEVCSVLTPGEAQVVEETNVARESNGSPPLAVDCRLMGSARRHAKRLAREMALYHSSGVAENVAVGPTDAKEAVVVWMRSPGHRANLLNRGYTRVGVAGFIGSDGRAYWVQQFSR